MPHTPEEGECDAAPQRYDVRVITEIRADLADLLTQRAAMERRSLRDQASWLLEQKLIEDRDRALSPTGDQPAEGEET